MVLHGQSSVWLSALLLMSFLLGPVAALAQTAYPPLTTSGYANPVNTLTPTSNAGQNRMVRLAPLNQGSTGTAYGSGSGFGDNSMALRGRVSVIPKGAMMMVRLDQPISSYNTNLGDPITATLENDLYVNDQVAIPAGSIIQGQVSNASKAGRLGKAGDMDIRFVSARTPDGMIIPMRAHVVTPDESGVIRGDKTGATVAKGVGYALGGTALGTVAGVSAGALLGSVGTGAVFGLSAGSLAGLSYAVLRKGKEVVLPSGSRLSLVADQTTSVTP
jgi:hypothetical protein